MTPKLAADRLAVVAERLKAAKPGTRLWRELQDELDRLCGTEEKPRDRVAEAAWEKGRKG
ncbi:MAG: hypothetical protein ACREMO_08670 [Gemmatimonadales bacterium]